MIRRGRGYLKVREEPAPEASVQLERDGCVVIRGLLSPVEVAQLREEIGAIYDRDPPGCPHPPGRPRARSPGPPSPTGSTASC